MSRVYFHAERNDAELSGRERAWWGVTVSDVAASFIPMATTLMDSGKINPTGPLGESPGDRPWELPERARLFLGQHEPVFQHPDDGPLDNFELIVNTALAIGSEPFALMANLHGQCEIHGYVEGPEREWLAGVIEQGRKSGVMRAAMGWEDVTKLLRLSDSEPVVLSYSVTDGFPNPHTSGLESGAWYALSLEEQWRTSLAGLRESGGLRLSPDTLRTPYGHNRSMLDLFA